MCYVLCKISHLTFVCCETGACLERIIYTYLYFLAQCLFQDFSFYIWLLWTWCIFRKDHASLIPNSHHPLELCIAHTKQLGPTYNVNKEVKISNVIGGRVTWLELLTFKWHFTALQKRAEILAFYILIYSDKTKKCLAREPYSWKIRRSEWSQNLSSSYQKLLVLCLCFCYP